MPKYDQKTDELAKWLFPIIDRRDCGEKVGNDIFSHHTNRTIEASGRGQYPPRQISRTDLQTHLYEGITLYYRSKPYGGFALLMVDIDAHEGQRDAQACAEWLRDTHFPGAYWEPSTNGAGAHLYLLVRTGKARPATVNALAVTVATALREIAQHAGFEAKIDLLSGNPSDIRRDNQGRRQVVKRGVLAKVPRLLGVDASILMNSTVFFASHLRSVIDRAAVLSSAASQSASTLSSPIVEERSASLSPLVSNSSNRLCIPKGYTIEVIRLKTPIERANWAVRTLARDLGRMPSVEEAVSAYTQWGLHTGEDVRNRRRERLAEAIRFTEQTFDPALTITSGYQTRRAELFNLIRRTVRPEHLDATGLCYKRNLTDEDLAIALYTVERATFHTSGDFRRHTCGNSAIQGMFKQLKSGGETDRGCNRNKAVTLKKVLERASLIDVIDDTKVVAGRQRGRSYRIVVGPAHPRRCEYDRQRRIDATSSSSTASPTHVRNACSEAG